MASADGGSERERGRTEGRVAMATLACAKHRGTVSTVNVEINRTWWNAAD